MMNTIWLRIRKWLAHQRPDLFSRFYSTMDDPQIVPVQAAAYRLARDRYLREGDKVLDVGFGLGYGLEILAVLAASLVGVDIDRRAVENSQHLLADLPAGSNLRHYDGKHLPFPDRAFDLVTCIDVLEHVPDYQGLLREMVRVSQRFVVVATPNRRTENTLPDGRPRNPWHLREWDPSELAALLKLTTNLPVTWHFLDGPWGGPFEVASQPGEHTQALVPVIQVQP
jgi:2-polyprenyl-3-methyl-5-hydroxy-6-metoxy-1,4-benzoquinol methylase